MVGWTLWHGSGGQAARATRVSRPLDVVAYPYSLLLWAVWGLALSVLAWTAPFGATVGGQGHFQGQWRGQSASG